MRLLPQVRTERKRRVPVAPDLARPAPPSADKRWKLVDATMRRMGNSPRGLIESLHTVQEVFGYLDLDALRFVARSLRVPLSRAYGVATFYHFFSLRPPGDHTCVVCIGTACYIKGAPLLLAAIKAGTRRGSRADHSRWESFRARCALSRIMRPGARRRL